MSENSKTGSNSNQSAARTIPRGLNFVGFQVDPKLSITLRAAQALAWAAKNFPLEYVSYQQLTQAIMGYARLPSAKSQEVERLRKLMSARIRHVLEEKYELELVAQPGIGVRATVDDTDRLRSVLPKKASRLKAARTSFVKTAVNIDIQRVPNTPENKQLKDWYSTSVIGVHGILKQIATKEFERKLLPPGSESADEK